MRFRSMTILIILMYSLHVSGQMIAVKSQFSEDSIMIGNHVEYSITVESPDDIFVRFPEYSDTITGQLEILKESKTDTLISDDGRILKRSYVLTSFEPGWNTVPPQAVTYETGGFLDTVYTDVLLLTVLAPVIDTTLAIKPIKPPVNTPVSFTEILPWTLIAIGAILLVLLGIYLYKRYVQKKEHPELFSKKPLEPAHIIAKRDLEKLRSEKLPQNGRVKDYYTRLTGTIRVYMARQFNISAMESTSAEILDAFIHHPNAEDKQRNSLENLLMLADLVKFAKEDPLMEENDRHLANAESFIEETYKLFIVEEEELKEEVEQVEKEENNG
jgi:hypothetical protein